MNDEQLSWTQYVPGQKEGHYESFYQRGNHPTRPLAFWIRYTIFSPKGRPEDAIGELWSIFFDGETGEHVAAKEEHPLRDCSFAPEGMDVRVGGATLVPGHLTGGATSSGNTITWDLSYAGKEPMLFLIPRSLYSGGFPKAKSLVGSPLAGYDGTLTVNGRTVDIDGWVGSQNHNWGSQHTDYYAFGQVAGFDGAPGSFLEVITAQTKVGPIKTPFMTLLVLRHDGREYAITSPTQAAKAKGSFGYFHWDFATGDDEVAIKGHVEAPAGAFVGLNYYNPPGGIKHCLNTKIGSCELTVTDKASGRVETLRTENRALFEILTDDRAHGIEIKA
ncbi:hypothetical protein Cs7R123_05590 [Catellatospora sp. TT07R-123]|uniref:hypothetical protein n=1 Tax=Catellatospora sp. TT07R-123 TaxID=2733863 RepID=UPI001B01ACAD|nr:hypothetical protein [Catellatospora sp. TT07R-123]GHJ43217.1 hypothetical protein Cs7R123_05590 [Catellatospora sp. TT07R-123]